MSSSLITKKALATSLKEVMNHVPFNKITVKHIVDSCGLNRQTFYYHFQDIYDLLGWVYKTEAVESIAQYRSYNTWTHGLLKIFLYIENNKAFCVNTLNSLARTHLDHYLYSVTTELIMGVVNEVSCEMEVKEEDKKFIANFYTLAFTGLVIQWMEHGMKEDPEEMIEKLNELVEGNFAKALQRYEHKPQ
ncbi:dihydroxyacetone kinase transcriptional activator DhaS [Paenibacillus sp. MER TA 81-3]|uniref:dihydroxyacetone kinase transcriptional activator DhaS n=1 Tax=Paenibacillus sp. MER TA 81-3 TaxID=2939573 RepID=UPI00203B03A9|nr:dihydroxyacetone kinase transcriptional activator DhaS [Paenibacillus sp. MER TA 81-3]MCM3337513.1 dihydroxyacetone kinase transcriptional activator DhaS [Paenibacillus sp. MER TA 81-3]